MHGDDIDGRYGPQTSRSDEGIDETDPAQYDSTTSFWLYNNGMWRWTKVIMKSYGGEDGGCPENSLLFGPPPRLYRSI